MLEWKKVKIENIGRIITGKTPKTTNSLYYGGDIPFLTPSDDMSIKYVKKTMKTLTEEGKLSVKNSTLPANAICVSCIGSDLGKVVITTEETVTNQQINSIIVDEEKFDIDFIYYSLVKLGEILKFHSKTSTAVPIVNKRNFSQYEINCPTLNTQKKIGKILSSIDKKIELNTKINNNLEQQLQTIFNYWFTQFEFPMINCKPYKSSGGKMIWSEEIKEYIPENWHVTKLDNFINFLSGFPFPSSSYCKEGKYKLITIKNVQDSGINTKVDNFIEATPLNTPDYCYLKPMDLLMSLTGNVGRIGLVYTENCLLNQRVCLVQPKKREQTPYIYMLMKSEKMRKTLETIAGGSSQKNLSPIETGQLLVAYNESVISQFSELTIGIVDQINKNLFENEKLEDLRSYLLPLLMNGQATIED